jgi:hypothetical protein
MQRHKLMMGVCGAAAGTWRAFIIVSTALEEAAQAISYVRSHHILLARLSMAPHPGIDTDVIKAQARKDLLNLLEGVCKDIIRGSKILPNYHRFPERRTS